MNYKHLTVFALAAALTLGSCNEKKQDTAKQSLPQGATEKAMTIRYVDGDTIMEKYNLAKDLNESMLRRQNQLDAAQQQRSTEINKFGSTMQQKYKNNQYLTQESFNSDQAKLQKMQSDAQTYLRNAPWFALCTGGAIVLLILSFSLLSEGLQRSGGRE